jgi:hypothetical protein
VAESVSVAVARVDFMISGSCQVGLWASRARARPSSVTTARAR